MLLGPAPSRDDYYTALRLFMLSQALPSGIEVVQAQDNRVAEPEGADYVIINEIGRRRISADVTTYADCTFTGSAVGEVLTVTAIRLGSITVGNRLLGENIADGTAVGPQLTGDAGGPGTYSLTVAQPAAVSGVPLSCGQALISQPTEITIQVDIYGPGAADNTSNVTTLLRDGFADLWFRRQGYFDRGIGLLDVGEVRQMAFVDGENQFEDRYSFDVKMQVNQVTSPSQDFADSISIKTTPADTYPVGVDTALTADESGVVTVTPVTPSLPTAVVAALSRGLGYVQYTEKTGQPNVAVDANVRVPIVMVIDPTLTSSTLTTPFDTFTFFDGTTIFARQIGDAYDIRLTLAATAAVAGGSISIDATINGGTQLTDIDTAPLTAPAGTSQKLSFKLKVFPKTTFVANGARLYITSTVLVAINSETLIIEPISAAA